MTDEQLQILIGSINQRFDAIDTRFDAVDQRLDKVTIQTDDLNRRMGNIDKHFEHIDARFNVIATELKSLKDNTKRQINGLRTRLDEQDLNLAKFYGSINQSLQRILYEKVDREELDRYVTSIDKDIALRTNDDHERLILSNQVADLAKEVKMIAQKIS